MEHAKNSELTEVAENGGSKRFSLSTIAACLFWMFLSGGMIMFWGYSVRNTIALMTNGVEAVGEVISSNLHSCGSRKRRHICYDHTISTETLGTITLDLGTEYAIGSRILVTFEPRNHENVYPGAKPTIVSLDWLQYGAIILFVLAVFFFCLGWHGVVYGLGVRRKSLKISSYIFTFAFVAYCYFWLAMQFTSMSGMEIAENVFVSLQTAL